MERSFCSKIKLRDRYSYRRITPAGFRFVDFAIPPLHKSTDCHTSFVYPIGPSTRVCEVHICIYVQYIYTFYRRNSSFSMYSSMFAYYYNTVYKAPADVADITFTKLAFPLRTFKIPLSGLSGSLEFLSLSFVSRLTFSFTSRFTQ